MASPAIYAVRSSNYLESVSSFAKNLLASTQESELIVVLPNYLAMDLFKFVFANLQISEGEGACFVPRTLIYEDYLALFDSIDSNINLKHYEQVLIMTSIIRKYKKTPYNSVDAILISNQIIKIYWELKKNNISYSEINNWVEEDISEHWWAAADFLKFCFISYDEIVERPSAGALESDITNKVFLFVGILDGNIYENIIANHATGKLVIILPPLTDFASFKINNHSGLIQDNKFLYSRYKKFLNHVNEINAPRSYDKYPCYLVEFYDIFEEADYIFHKIYTCGSSISIILNNHILEKLITNKLDILSIPYNSSFGISYNNFLEVELLLNLAKFKSSDGNIADMISVLKSRVFLHNEKIQKINEVIFGQKRFFENFRDFYHILLNDSDEGISLILAELNEFLEFKHSNKFSDLLHKTVSTFVILYENSGRGIQNTETEKFKNFIIDIQKLPYQEYEIEYEEYSAFIYHLFSLKYTKAFNRNSQIFLLRPEDSLLIDTEEIFFADFNQESYLEGNIEDIWLSKKILKKLGLHDESHNFETLQYIISTKLDKQKVCFTRSNYNNGALIEKCAILNLIPNLKKLDVKIERKGLAFNKLEPISLSLSLLPKILYPTNIEQLIRDPYGFFARKILGLKKQMEIDDLPESKDYGQVVHELIENVTLNQEALPEKLVEDILAIKAIPANFAFLWKKSLCAIALLIREINKNILSKKGKIFAEIEGKCEIKLLSTDITLKAIADRIEVLEDRIRIIDFKTGQVPSRKDISQGRSPQLLIEAIILINKGFSLLSDITNKSIELVYIKVNTREPYFEETVISIEYDEIIKHQEALKEFLNFYYQEEGVLINNNYLPEFWKPDYDDYKHFRRVMS